MTAEDDAIPVNLRPLRLLEVLADAGEPLTPTEIAARLGLPKQTGHRLCQMLEREGFLERLGTSTRLLPGRRIRTLSAGMLHGGRFHLARHQILCRVSEALGETVNFVVPEAEGMRYRDRVETDWAFRIQLPVGSHVPFHCTASGKTFLASLPAEERRRMVVTLKLEALTPRTFADPSALLAHLENVAAAGHALDDEEFITGMIALAVPVRDAAGRYLASLAFHAPVSRFPLDRARGEVGRMTEAAEELGALLGGS